jgi:hypothetical protein
MSFVRTSRRASGASLSARVSVATLAIAVLSGGCAATSSGPSKVAGPVSGFPGDPAPLPPVVQSAKVVIEADGLPAQLAPRYRRPVPDEPTEPWSPNYGTVRPDATDAAPVEPKADITTPVAPVTRIATQVAAPRLDPDDIIRLAIAEHEMRQR